MPVESWTWSAGRLPDAKDRDTRTDDYGCWLPGLFGRHSDERIRRREGREGRGEGLGVPKDREFADELDLRPRDAACCAPPVPTSGRYSQTHMLPLTSLSLACSAESASFVVICMWDHTRRPPIEKPLTTFSTARNVTLNRFSRFTTPSPPVAPASSPSRSG